MTARWMAVAWTLGLLGVAMPASARTLEDITMPDTITVAGKKLVLNGMGIREATIFKVDVYVAGLYLEHKTHDPKEVVESNQVKRLVLHFVRDVDRDDVVDAYKESFRKNNPKTYGAIKDKVARFLKMMSGIDDGQEMVYTIVPGKGVEVVIKGKRKGVIEGDDFARAFLRIWFGPHPPNSGLKKGLLGR